MQLPSPLGQNPSLPAPFYASAFANLGGSIVFGLTADLVNPTFGAPAPLLLNIPIVAGKKYLLRGTLRLAYTSVGGVSVVCTHPGMASGIQHSRGSGGAINTYLEATAAVGGSPMTIGGGAFVTFAGSGILFFELSFIASGTGPLDFTIAPNNGGQTATCFAGSVIELVESLA